MTNTVITSKLNREQIALLLYQTSRLVHELGAARFLKCLKEDYPAAYDAIVGNESREKKGYLLDANRM